jgi:hypothetical protein
MHVATSLRNWLPSVLQAVDPWMSKLDIASGQRWQPELTDKLADCAFGIICVTRSNQGQAWLNFEAGALSKAISGKTSVCPYLYKLEVNELEGPLSQFQARKADKEGTRQLVSSINERLEVKLSDQRVAEAFDNWWPKLEEAIASFRSAALPPIKRRSEQDLLLEILENTRAIRRSFAQPSDAQRPFKLPPRSPEVKNSLDWSPGDYEALNALGRSAYPKRDIPDLLADFDHLSEEAK